MAEKDVTKDLHRTRRTTCVARQKLRFGRAVPTVCVPQCQGSDSSTPAFVLRRFNQLYL